MFTDHQIILVLDKKLEGVNQGVFFFFAGFRLYFFSFRKLLRGKFFDRHDGESVGDHAYDGIDDRNSPPCGRAAAKVRHETDSDGLDQHAGAESEHEADGAHLHALMVVLGDQSCQSRVSDVVGCVEARVQQGVGNEEPGVLSRRAEISGNTEDRDKADRAAKISIEHPRSRLAHFGIGLIDQGTEKDVADAVKKFGDSDQSADDAGVHAHSVGQEDHDEGGEQSVDYVARDIAGAVTDLVDPCQVGLFFVLVLFVFIFDFFILVHGILLILFQALA